MGCEWDDYCQALPLGYLHLVLIQYNVCGAVYHPEGSILKDHLFFV